MEYYIITNSTNEKEIGDSFPQCKGIPKGYNFDWLDNENSILKLSNSEFPANNTDLIFDLKEDSILTDVVSVNNIKARGFVVNKKVKDCFNCFNIIDHKFYNASISTSENKYDYFWLHLLKKSLEGIDFKKSSFSEVNLFGEEIKNLSISSTDEYNSIENKKSDKFNRIIVKELRLTSEFKKLDMFFFPKAHSDIIISRKLLETMISLNIKGIKYKKVTYIS